MKLNKDQQLFIDTMLEALDNQFNDANDRLEELYKTYNTDLKKFEEKVASIIYEYEVKGEVLELTPKQKQQLKSELKKELGDTFKEEYYQEKEFIKSQLTEKGKLLYDYKSFLLNVGVDFDMLPLPMTTLNKIVNAEVNSKIWSERLWNNKKDIEARLQNNFKNLIDGKTDINKIKQDIRQTFNSNRYNTDRLVRNELTRVQSEINEVHDKKHGVEYQIFMATLDKKTTNTCRNLDGNVYKVDDKSKPIPPTGTHISCRSCLVAIPNKEWKPSTRRDNETGEIIEYKNYKEWGKDKGYIKQSEPLKDTTKDKIGDGKYKDKLEENYKRLDKNYKYLDETCNKDVKLNESLDGSYYSPRMNEVNMSLKNNVNDFAETFYHEFGHATDTNSFKELNNLIEKELQDRIFDGKIKYREGQWDMIYGFSKKNEHHLSTMIFDKKTLEKDRLKIIDMLMGNLDNEEAVQSFVNIPTKTGLQFHEVFNHIDTHWGGISDCVNAITNGDYMGVWGHGKEYFNNKIAKQTTEIYANITGAISHGDKDILYVYKELFPNTFKAYNQGNKLVAEILQGNTDKIETLLKKYDKELWKEFYGK